jgi:acyl carrier protein
VSDQSHAQRLTTLLAQTLRLEPEQIDDSLDMEETGTWDSLSHMELIAAIEDEFGIALTADEIVAMRSVAHIKATLLAKSISL